MYEDDVHVIVRRKADAEVEFGNTLYLAEQADGLIVDWKFFRDQVPFDSKMLQESHERIVDRLGVKVTLMAGDRGFVLEGLNRAGGLMLVKEMKEPPAPAPVNITAAIPTLPVILCGAFTPDAAGSELESDQAEVPKQLFMGRMVLPVTPRGIWPGERGVDIGDMHSVDGLSLGAPVVTAHLWTFTAELISALTRLGKLPPMYQSMVVPGGRRRNAEHLKLQWEPGPVEPIREGLLGREYLARVANSLRRLKTSQAEKFAEAGRLAADTAAAGHTVWYGSLGHLPPELPSIPGDPGLVKPLSMREPDKLADLVKPGDLILYVGYYEPWGPWVESNVWCW